MYSIQYHALFSVTAVGLGTHYPWIQWSTCILQKQKRPKNWALQYSMFQFPGRRTVYIPYKVLKIILAYFNILLAVGQIRYEPKVFYTSYITHIQFSQ